MPTGKRSNTTELERRVAEDPLNSETLFELTHKLIIAGRYGEALERASALVQLTDDAGAWEALGICKRRLGRSREAIEAYRLALDRDPLAKDAAMGLAVRHWSSTRCARRRSPCSATSLLAAGCLPV